MKKRTKKPLQLNRETIRNLHLRQVRGGEDTLISHCDGDEKDGQFFCRREIIIK